ncbi:Sec20-domain-containing protein [Crassisporium funariophilum]|nr:Sec20-domain-containing protein [Crassisporium funariophilum]
MAPLPSRLSEETLSIISAAERRYKHLAEVEVPKLRQCLGPLAIQQTLAEDLREDTVALTRQIAAIELAVDDQQGENSRRELRGIVDDFKKRLGSLRQDTRAALLTSKRAIDARSKSNKEELLAFASVLEEKQSSSEKTTEDSLMQANADVTDALRRTVALMQNELERSVLSTQMLDSSTATLRSSSLQHDTLSVVMSTSKQLVTALKKSDWLDRVLIFSGFGFFLLVVLFILKQRFVDKGLRIVFWWTRFWPDFGGDDELLMSAEKGMGEAVVGMTSSLAAAAASLASSLSVPAASSVSSWVESASAISSSGSVVSGSLQPSPSSLEEIIVAESDPTTASFEGVSEPSHRPESVPPEPLVHVEL